MRNIKCDENTDVRGCISYTTGDRNYYGPQIENITHKNKGFYSNSQYYILNQFK